MIQMVKYQWYIFLIFYHSQIIIIIHVNIIILVIIQAAIVSLGLIGAGTNNARIAGMLRNLSSYYYKEASHLFCVCFFHHTPNLNLFLHCLQILTSLYFSQVRIAQGLVHLGKGLLTLSPYHSDRFLLSP